MTDPAKLYADALGHLSAGRFEDTDSMCRQILKTLPTHADTLNLQGLAMLRSGKPERALTSFKKALKTNPNLVPVILNCGVAHAELGQRDLAENYFSQALQRDARSVEAHVQLGTLLQRRFKFEEASAHFRHVLEIDPNHALSHGMLGEGLLLQGRFEEAQAHMEKAIALNPKLASVYDNLALLAENQGRHDDALMWFERAIEQKPDFAGSRFNRAVVRLRRGDFAQGLEEYEWRWRIPNTRLSTLARAFPQPQWQGEDLNGGTLLIWGEQGVGDEIRMAALAQDLITRGENIALECDKRLIRFFERSFPQAKIIARREPPAKIAADPSIAYHSPAESLIRYVRPSLAHFPKREKYLTADPARTADFRQRLKGTDQARPLIGLSWGSYNPQLMQGKTTLLADWAPILNIKDALFVGLQYGDTRKERDTVEQELGLTMSHLTDLDLIKDLDGLAALISACDLVITVSNTTAHLAGALGVPTWVLLPFGHFQPWYWFSERSDSPWYPSVKLYRQNKFGDWPRVLNQVAGDLKRWKPNG